MTDIKESAVEQKLRFAAKVVVEALPDEKNATPKRYIINDAARRGMHHPACPRALKKSQALRSYITNKWPKLVREVIPEKHGILPCYINGFGGGYYRGNVKTATKQVAYNTKLAHGVVNAIEEFAQAAVEIFKIEATRHSLVTRVITKKK